MGLQTLCDGRRAFINCTREVLLKDYITLLPSPHTVVEVLESVPPDDLVKAALQRLKEAGYVIAFDDFTADDQRAPIADYADILKVDLQATTEEQRSVLVSRYGRGAAVCWRKRWKRGTSSRMRRRWGLSIFRDTFSAGRNSCRRKKCRRTA